MTPREGVEREEFLRYWGNPSPHDSHMCAVAYAAWLARASLAHPAATAREEAFYEAALAYFESDKARMAAFTGEVFIEGPESAAIAEAGKRLGAARAAYAALALARLVKGTEA